jgi:hypothetical protein
MTTSGGLRSKTGWIWYYTRRVRVKTSRPEKVPHSRQMWLKFAQKDCIEIRLARNGLCTLRTKLLRELCFGSLGPKSNST